MGINGYQLVILVVLALLILGPERLPDYAKKLAHWVRQLRVLAQDARVRFKEETGTDFDDVNWRQYDPRQYDPRRIIRDALSEDLDQTRRAVGSVRDAASLESDRPGPVRAATDGSGPGRSGTEDPGAEGPAPEREHDPRALFGGGATPAAVSGAVAAGLAGSASLGVSGRSAPAGAATTGSTDPADAADPTEAVRPAPFDVDAT
ncbi:Sec-independent protein translocase TatB [Nesterenkonia marinintestina]|uniref:Sec-independent protein translocase TatB n=1 Tax=Nesterenkonia marinintestina TaxID=2979865 RepID=UPI0021C13A24|nr:Sec-independent protein translocase TatB [Nesterenkonia sp. GX14115]